MQTLRRRLAHIGVKDPERHRLHDFRRGHARDLFQGGATLATILQAGEWRSAAFASYLADTEVEAAAVLEAHWVASSDEEEEE